MDASDVERIAAFGDRFARAQSTEIVELPWGFALLQNDFPDSYNHNRIVVTSDVSGPDILAATDDILGGAGRKYRYVSVVDDKLGRALKPHFIAAGYEHEPLVTMIYSGPVSATPVHHVETLPLEAMRPAIIRDWRVEMPEATDDVLQQLADRTALYSRGAEVTLLAVLEGDEIVARADLYVDRANSIAQIENVLTHPSFRSRGYGTSLVREALIRGQQARCRLSFLEADLGGWPEQWYRRLGYADVRRTHDFVRYG